MKKRWTAFFLAFLLGFGLTACGKTPGPDTNTDAPPSAAASAEATRQQTSAPFSADYWTAVRHESYDAMNDCMKTSAMPTEAWWVDLYLNEDGTAQFRDVLGSYYNTSLLDGNWWLGADSTLRLTGTMNTGEPLTLDGRIESTDSLAIETPYGDTFYFAPAERPGPGGEMGIADLYGTWRMTHYEEDGREYRPGEEHIASMLCFDRLWSDLLEGYVMRADWYHAAGLDTDTPQYRSEKHLLAEQIEEPLMPGLSNETWSVRLTDEETGAAFFAALTAIGAFFKIPFPLAAISMQFFFTAMAGVLLGAGWGALSQLVYVLIGLIGIPIFALGGGFSYVFQPTFGFLLGLIPCAFVIGKLAKRPLTFWRSVLSMLAGLAVLYAIGVPYMALIANGYLGKGLTFWQVIRSGMLIYLPGDLLKIAVSSFLCVIITRRLPQVFSTPERAKA